MRKIGLILFLSISSAYVFAQSDEREQLVKFLMQQINLEEGAIAQKDYAKGELFAVEAITALENAPEELQSEIVGAKGNIYYNIACYQSIQGKVNEGINSFEKAIENFYINYNHAILDPSLDNLRENERFITLMEVLNEKGNFLQILQNGGGYNNSISDTLTFSYLDPSDPNLVRVRELLNLDSIAGNGDEISQIKNLLYWAHNVVRHDGSSTNPKSKNAIDLVDVCRKEDRGINCRMMSQMLNECFLSLGFKARYVVCMPKTYIDDCHVINTVYSNTLDKWIWVDPTFNAYLTDENDMLLSIAEVRERLKTGETLILNEDANWNNINKQTKEEYLDNYMAKNLYYIICPLQTGYDTETDRSRFPTMISLYPSSSPEIQSRKKNTTDSPDYFWQKPL